MYVIYLLECVCHHISTREKSLWCYFRRKWCALLMCIEQIVPMENSKWGVSYSRLAPRLLYASVNQQMSDVMRYTSSCISVFGACQRAPNHC